MKRIFTSSPSGRGPLTFDDHLTLVMNMPVGVSGYTAGQRVSNETKESKKKACVDQHLEVYCSRWASRTEPDWDLPRFVKSYQIEVQNVADEDE